MEHNLSNTQAQERGREIDAGLRRHMGSVYNRMAVGVLITAITAWVVSHTPALLALFLGGPQAYVVMLAPLAVVWFGFRPERMSSSKLMLAFGAICVLYGISFASIFIVFTGESIARAFFMAAALYAGLSIYGYTTKKNLDALGTFAVMGVLSVLVLSLGTMVAAMFGADVTLMTSVISGLGLLAFSGITAWETQRTKEMYDPAYGGEANSRMAWSAALSLYISFIAIFQYILHFVGNRN